MVYLAADHRGLIRKEEMKKLLDEMGERYVDVGNQIYDPGDDEVDFVNKGCQRIERDMADHNEDAKGLFFCGSGVMVDVAANRFPGIRSCLAINKAQVEMARHDDDVNVLCVAAEFFASEETKQLVRKFLKTEFSGEERFVRRIEKLKS